MKRLLLFFIVFLTLFLFSSCGIPTVYVPQSSDIKMVINGDDLTQDNEIKLNIELSNELFNELENSQYTLLFFYTVSNSSESSNYSKLIDAFNSEYALETEGTKLNNSSATNGKITTITQSNIEYSLFQCSISDTSLLDINQKEITLIITIDQDDIVIKNLDNPEEATKITRVNGSSFFDNSETYKSTGEIASDSNYDFSQYEVSIYPLISATFLNYSNTYNTKLNTNFTIKLEN